MPGDVVSTDSNPVTNPEAAIEGIRKSFVRGDATRIQAAVATAGIAMMAFGLQRHAAVDDAEAFCKSLSASSGDNVEVDEQIFLDWCAHNTAAVASTAHTMRALILCEFGLLDNLAAEVDKHSTAGNAAWEQMIKREPDILEQEDLALWVGVLRRLPLVAKMFSVQGHAQQHLLEGKRHLYQDELKRVLAIIEEAKEIVVSLYDPYAPVFRQVLSQTEQGVKAQLTYLKNSLGSVHIARLPAVGNKVFIIHGHDEASWRDLKDLLKEEFKLDAVVLKQEASSTRTLIEKFEEEATQCAFAIALVTPDDLVKKSKSSTWQARPNVLFELGWFYGRLGPSGITIVKKGEDTALPSDLGGIVSVTYARNVAEILLDLRKELRAAKLIS